MKEKVSDKSCWNCKYQDLNNDSFLGKCKWFPIHRNEPAKDIPARLVDIGCKYFENK
jgi:hypothetical protein